MPKIMDVITLTGGAPSVSTTPNVLIRDVNDRRLLVVGVSSAVPSGKKEYAIGCLFICSDNGAMYRNTGTTASCTFTLIGTVGAGGVALTNLAAGITPSHVVKYGGTITWSGSGASLATTVSGVAATDLVVASFLVSPTQAAYITKIVPTTNTLTITLSAANTGNDAQISYIVYRAAA